jgi:hypothetical protein
MSVSRRHLFRLLGSFGAAAAMSPGGAWAQRPPRILEGGAPPPRNRAYVSSPELARVLPGVRVGNRRQHDALSVFWLHGAAGAPLDLLTLEDALTRRLLVVTEGAQARVPEILVENVAGSHVLLLAGEILVGGKQNRVLTEDILLPPKSGPRAIGVYCVEQGRWEGGRTAFRAGGTLAAPGLRSRLMAKTDQRRVWEEVARQSQLAQTSSPTASYQAIYDSPEVQKRLGEVEQAMGARPVADALGAAVFVGPKLSGIDLFLDHDLFTREWPKLIRAHALEAYRVTRVDGLDEAGLRAQAAELLRLAAGVKGELRDGGGVGQLFEFQVQGAQGMALTFEGRVLHVALT